MYPAAVWQALGYLLRLYWGGRVAHLLQAVGTGSPGGRGMDLKGPELSVRGQVPAGQPTCQLF
jgi:hypothetical protein